MLGYTTQEIYSMIRQIVNSENIKLNPCGNHHLKRHLVYEVLVDNKKKYIFKIYYKKNRRDNEMDGLNLLINKEILVPKVIDYGSTHNEEDWLLTEFLEGTVLDNVIEEISSENLCLLFKQIGEQLGKIHSLEVGNGIIDVEKEYLMRIEDLKKQSYPHQELMMKAFDFLDCHKGILNKLSVKERFIHQDFDGRNILVRKDKDTYVVSGIIDFEISRLGFYEKDLIGLYYRYFLENETLLRSFNQGYTKYIKLSSQFQRRLPLLLVHFCVSNCSWAYEQAPEYYQDNIIFLQKLLNKEELKKRFLP